MRIRDTLSKQLRFFEPDNPVRIYYCGLTVSDSPHLGHARGWIHTDVLRRFLEYQGYTVHYVENITDINEKIFNQLGDNEIDAESEQELADLFASEVLSSMSSLNLKRADVYPRVSNHIDEIIEYISSLIDEGYAYESNDSVYFDVNSFDEYGKLSNQPLNEVESQGSADELPEKRSERDFALWKAVKPDKTRGQTWSSPWGHGRPGWHIECSVMSQTHLELPIDIHIGGQDLVFPHHENEIAQSEALEDTEFARNWMHIRLLESDNDEKMSSSRNNFRTVQSSIKEYGSNSVRWFLLSSNYDSNQSYSEEKLADASDRWSQIKISYNMIEDALMTSEADSTVSHDEMRDKLEKYREQVERSLSENLNTRESLASVQDVASVVRKYVSNRPVYDQNLLHQMIDFYEDIIEDILGFRLKTVNSEGVIEDIADYRDNLREEGKYDMSDTLRNAIEHAGYKVKDSDSGTIVIKED
jgi:cysteinyl-tRNA synthetase